MMRGLEIIKPKAMNVFGDLVPLHEMDIQDWVNYIEREDWRKVIDAFNELEDMDKLIFASSFHSFHQNINLSSTQKSIYQAYELKEAVLND